MKKFLSFLIVIVIAFTLVGCNSKKDPISEYSSPIITVEPKTMEIYKGDEIDLMYGVTVTDEYDSNISAVIASDDDFDKDTEGEYTITYSAKNSHEKSATATRKVIVNAPLARIGLTVQQNFGDKWAENNGLTMTFAQDKLYTLTESKDYTIADDPETEDVDESKQSPIMSGIFYNDSDEEITVNFAGTHGEVAVINKNGIVVLGVDGANGRYVNEQYPVRMNAPSNTLATQIGKDLKIPSKGYAVVLQNTGNFDEDGRSFICKNVIAYYGTQVLLSMDDGSKDFTEFVNQAPVVKGNDVEIKVVKGDETFTENLKERLLQGVTITDDNGTFEISDDRTLTAEDVVVKENSSFDINTVGKYEFTLTVKDAEENERSFTRTVSIFFIPTSNYISVTQGVETSYLTDLTFLYNVNYASSTSNQVVGIYDNTFDGTTVAGWSVYGIVNKNTGVIVELGDWSKIYSDTNPAGITQENAGDVAKGVVERLGEEELLIIFGNSGGNPPTGARAFGSKLISLYKGETKVNTVKLTINVTGDDNLIVQPSEARFKNGSLVTLWQVSEFGLNEAYKNTAGRINIYDNTYEGTFSASYSVYAIITADGTVKEVGDWSKTINAENPTGSSATAINQDILANLLEGEYLVIFANDGLNAVGQGRWFGTELLKACSSNGTFNQITLELLNILN